nr:glycosyl hydrolase [Paenibacillus sp. CAA11]
MELKEYGWKDEIQRFIEEAEKVSIQPSGWDREKKAGLLEGIVRYYAKHQQEDGGIVDPFSGAERYYSTPSYAAAAAALVAEGREDLLSSAAAALTHSIELVVGRAVPDHHPDFYPVMIMAAYRLLKDRVAGAQAESWRAMLARIDPEEDYIFTMSRMKNINRMINWNAIMLSGEYLRFAEGISEDGAWLERYLQESHLLRLTLLGLYQDGPLDLPNSPFAYDIVTRMHLSLMIQAGYNGPSAAELREKLRRGALSSLLMLSPLGEIPPRGRSAQHQWNEAAAACVFTLAAGEAWRSGERVLAGAFRRAAGLCFEAIHAWQTEEGCLQIVRNHYPPSARHGFEVYTNHTCYNLWTAAALAFALQDAEVEEIPETPIPAEAGSRVLEVDGWFQTVISSVPGSQVAVQTSLNDPYNIPGIVRVQEHGLPRAIGPSASGHSDQGFTEYAEGEVLPLSYSPMWQTSDGVWHSLSEGVPSGKEFDRDAGIDPAAGGVSVQLEEAAVQEGHTSWMLRWRGPFPGVKEIVTRYSHQRGSIEAVYSIIPQEEEGLLAAGALFPVLVSDGSERSETVRTGEQGLCTVIRGAAAAIAPLTEGAALELPEPAREAASRSGLLREARLVKPGALEIGWRLTLSPQA